MGTAAYLRARGPAILCLALVAWTVSALGRLDAAPPAILKDSHVALIDAVAFSPDGKLLAAGGMATGEQFKDGILQIWDVKGRRVLTSPEVDAEEVRAVAFSPDGATLASGTRDGVVHLWSVDGAKLRHRLDRHFGEVKGVAFSRDGKLLATSGTDRTVRLWNVQTGEEQRIIEAEGEGMLGPLSLSPDGATVAAIDLAGNAVVLWDVGSGERLAKYKAQGLFVAFSPDGRTLALPDGGRSIQLANAKTGRPKRLLRGRAGLVMTVAFSPDGKLLASAGEDGSLSLWQVGDGRLLTTLKGHRDAVYTLAFSPDGKILASGSGDGSVRLWDLPD